MAKRKNWTLFRGASALVRVGPIKDHDGAVKDLAGLSGELSIRPLATSANPPTLTKSMSVLGAPSAGILQSALITRAETLTIAPGVYAYSAMITTAGAEDVVVLGEVTVKYDIRDA